MEIVIEVCKLLFICRLYFVE